MQSKLLSIGVLALAFSLSSCTSFANDSWKEEFGTPELFLEKITDHWCYIYPYSNRNEQSEDTNLEIKDALSKSGPYVVSERTSSPSEKFFTYENYLSPSTSGPNYCTMSVYEDGFVLIDHKSALGPHQFAYFEMEEEKASSVVDLAFTKIEYEKKVSSEDYAKALEEGSIQNFLSAMQEEDEIRVKVCETGRYLPEVEPFIDKGELLELIKEQHYELTAERVERYYVKFQYNYHGPEDLAWSYYLGDDFDKAFLDYEYVDRIGRKSVANLCYLIDAKAGKAIYEKALELSKAS